MNKKAARKFALKQRDELTDAERMKGDDLILIQFQTVELPFLTAMMSFFSLEDKKEVNSFILTDYLLFRNPSLHISYPRMKVSEITMEAVLCTADTAFENNEYGISEPMASEIIPPEELDLVLVPLLAFDKTGQRVGYGKGYYDRFLKECREDCIRVGISYFDPIDTISDTNEYDVPLDLCITPRQVYVF